MTEDGRAEEEEGELSIPGRKIHCEYLTSGEIWAGLRLTHCGNTFYLDYGVAQVSFLASQHTLYVTWVIQSVRTNLTDLTLVSYDGDNGGDSGGAEKSLIVKKMKISDILYDVSPVTMFFAKTTLGKVQKKT